MRLFHGGAPWLHVGSLLLPPALSGVPDSATLHGWRSVGRRDRVYVTVDESAAALYAAFHPSNRGTVYEVAASGLEHDEDCLAPGYSFACHLAQIVSARELSWRQIERARRKLVGGA